MKDHSRWKRISLAVTGLALAIAFGLVLPGCGRHFLTARITPADETPRETSVSVVFSQPVLMGKQREMINVPFTEPFMTFDPPIAGEYRWTSETELQFMPYERLSADQTYKVELPKKVFGRRLRLGRSGSFRTAPFRLEDARVYFDFYIFDIGKKNIVADLAFNYDVDVEDLKRFARLTKDGKDFPFEVVPRNDRSHYRLVSDAIGKDHHDQDFKIEVSKDLPNAESGTTLQKGWDSSLRLDKIPDFQYDGLRTDRRGQETVLTLRFNKAIQPEFVASYVGVDDESGSKPSRVAIQTRAETALLMVTGDFKFNRRYRVRVNKALSAVDGSTLKSAVEETFTLEKPQKSIQFLQPGRLLPVKNDVNIFVQSYDLKKMTLQVYRVPPGNIPFMARQLEGGAGKMVHTETVNVPVRDEFSTNVTEINLKSFIEKHGKGMFRIQVRGEEGWPRSDKWVLGTDIGLVVKNDGRDLLAFCGSLTTFNPLEGVSVSLLNGEGETVRSAQTDASGFAVIPFDPEKVGATPYMLTAQQGEDTAYLLFSEAKVEITKSDVAGDPYRVGALEAFVYPARDLFKPGEEVQLASIVKKIGGGRVDELPVRWVVRDSQGGVFFEENAALNGVGMCDIRFALNNSAKTGSYSAALSVGKNLEIGRTTFRVEEFIPQSLKVDINVKSENLRPGMPLVFQVQGRNLFGNAAGGQHVSANAEISYKPFTPSGYANFRFENSRFSFQTEKETLADAQLDEQGLVQYETPIPDKTVPHGLLNARLYAEVSEKGGRAVAVVKNVEIADKPYFLGLKRTQEAFSSLETPTRFEIVSLDRRGNPVTVKDVEIFIVRHGYYNIYQKARWQNGGKYDTQDYQDIVFRKHIPELKGKTLFAYKHETLGSYEIIVAQRKDDVSANLDYSVAGAGDVDVDLEKAEQLQLQWGRESYKVGDTAELSINAPMTGLLMLTVEREKVLYRQFIRLTRAAQVVKIPVKEEFLPNAYAVGMLFKTFNDADPSLPVKAYGALPLRVEQDSARLKLDLRVPDVISPDSSIEVEVRAPVTSEEATLTLSVVEEGALDITGFTVPSPSNFFMRKRGLTVDSFDTFSLVMGDLPNLKADLTVGGGEDVPSDKHMNPVQFRKRKTVAYWSGLVKLSPGGTKISVPIGGYNGSLRFMAVASAGNRVGEKEISRAIFAPIILQPTVPQAIAPEDRLNIPLSVFNKTGKRQSVTLTVKTDGPLNVRGTPAKTFDLEQDEEKFLDYRVEAVGKLGAAALLFQAQAGDVRISQQENLAVRPASAKETVSRQGVLAKGRTVRLDTGSAHYPETQSGQLLVSPYPEAEHLGHLDYLLRYPYGCLEQIVSVAFPQLSVGPIAQAVAPFLHRPAREKAAIKEAITEVERRFKPEGFDLWNNYQATPYLSIYVTHFLVDASQAGYQVKEEVYQGALKNIEERVVALLRPNMSGEDLFNGCYGLYVLAKGGKALRETMEFTKTNLLKEDSNILAWLYLAAAYGKTGDKDGAMVLLSAKKDLVFPEEFAWWGNPYMTDTAAQAILAATLLEVAPTHPSLKIYLDSLTQKARQAEGMNTHESAWILQVFAKLFKEDVTRSVNASVKVNDREIPVSGRSTVLPMKDLAAATVTLNNKGESSLYYSLYSEAYPRRSDYDRPSGQGITVQRELLNGQGNPLDLKTVQQGDLVVQRVRVETSGAGNVVVVVPFAGGLEIENPRLKKTEGLEWIPDNDAPSRGGSHESKPEESSEENESYGEREESDEGDGESSENIDQDAGSNSLASSHSDNKDDIDIREDRVLIFTDFQGSSGSRTYYLAFRAVFPGEFRVPYVFAEDMYRVEKNGRSESHLLFISSRE